jgi:UDPglucose 6-dehydrogenase
VQEKLGDKIKFAMNAYDACEGADFLVIATEWSVFRTPDFKKLGESLSEKVIFDGRNLYDRETMEKYGFDYISIGRNPVFAK